MTLNLKLGLYRVKMKQHAKYLGHTSYRSKVIARTHTNWTPTALPGPLKWSVKTTEMRPEHDVCQRRS